MRRARNVTRAGNVERALFAIAMVVVLGLSLAGPAWAQSGGGNVNNALVAVDADGTYASCGSADFGDADGSYGPIITFNDGVPGNTYDQTGTANGALKWGEWAAAPGATGVESGSGATQDGRYILATSTGPLATVELFRFEVFDSNGEADVGHVRIGSDYTALNTAADEVGGGMGHAVTGAELAQTALPATGPGVDADGYAVWDPTPGDGYVCVQFRYTWPAGPTPGTYTQKAYARDEGAEQAAPSPGDDDATTFATTSTATLDFTDAFFTGQTDASFDVDIDGVMDFHWVVAASPAADPSLLTFDQSSLNDADGALAIPMAADETVWIYYAVDMISSGGSTVLKDQTYASAFSWA